MKNLLFCSVVIVASMVFVFSASTAMGQSQTRQQADSSVQSHAQSGSQTKQSPTGSAGQVQGNHKAANPKLPWKLSSRIHMEKGSNKGYLVVQMDLKQGYHVYSVNPKGSPAPTTLKVLPSNDLRVLSKFASDKPPIVIEKDPVFGQRVEKHKGQVQFFATIEVRPGIDLQKLVQEVQFSGQVCSENACQPIQNQSAKAMFSGFFENPQTRNAANDQQLK